MEVIIQAILTNMMESKLIQVHAFHRQAPQASRHGILQYDGSISAFPVILDVVGKVYPAGYPVEC
jgi:hypothetical protein